MILITFVVSQFDDFFLLLSFICSLGHGRKASYLNTLACVM
jgi:hypothetical protein